MSLMERYQKAMNDKNEDEMNDILHDDFKFTMHASGNVLSKSDVVSWAMSDDINSDKDRIVYENDEIAVLHAFVTFNDGNTQAVMSVFKIENGKILVKIPRKSAKSGDITGGLPRVADLFEARKPKDGSIYAEASGVLSYGKETKGRKRLVITPDKGEPVEMMIQKYRAVSFLEGDYVEKGDILCHGPVDTHSLLAMHGVEELAKHLIAEVQDVYRLQGVVINDKHIETISRQMMKKVTITDQGDSEFLEGDIVELTKVRASNKNLVASDKKPAIFDRMLLGITKAALSTDSFVSAASFQETTRVLTDAAIKGKVDPLNGLKAVSYTHLTLPTSDLV